MNNAALTPQMDVAGWDPKLPFDLVVAYEDLETRNRALHLYDHLAQQLLDDYDFQCSWWKFDHLANGHVRLDADGIADDAAFEFLDAVYLPRLMLDGHVLMDDADAALLRHSDGETGFGDRVHRGGDHREVDADFAGQPARERDFARQYF